MLIQCYILNVNSMLESLRKRTGANHA